MQALHNLSDACINANLGDYNNQRTTINTPLPLNRINNNAINQIPIIDPNGNYTNEQIQSLIRHTRLIANNIVQQARSNNVSNIAYLVNATDTRALPSLQDQLDQYRRQLFIDGVEYLCHTYWPSWNTIKHVLRRAGHYTVRTLRALRVVLSTVKDMLPLKSNIEKYANQGLGFEVFGDPDYFDLAYKNNCGVKKMYKLNKGTCKNNFVYSEIYMPVTILQKTLFAQISLQNEFSPDVLYLINCANKGLESML